MVKKKENVYDWLTVLNEDNTLIDIFKKGVIEYINRNNLSPKNKTELNKIIEDYKKLPVGA